MCTAFFGGGESGTRVQQARRSQDAKGSPLVSNFFAFEGLDRQPGRGDLRLYVWRGSRLKGPVNYTSITPRTRDTICSTSHMFLCISLCVCLCVCLKNTTWKLAKRCVVPCPMPQNRISEVVNLSGAVGYCGKWILRIASNYFFKPHTHTHAHTNESENRLPIKKKPGTQCTHRISQGPAQGPLPLVTPNNGKDGIRGNSTFCCFRSVCVCVCVCLVILCPIHPATHF